MAPLMFERVHALKLARAERTAAAHSQVIELARQGAEAQEETISSVRALLQIVASVFVKMPFETVDCNHYLTNLASNIPWIKALSIQMYQRNPRNQPRWRRRRRCSDVDQSAMDQQARGKRRGQESEEAHKSIEDLMITHAEAPRGLVTISVGVNSLMPRKDHRGRSGRDC